MSTRRAFLTGMAAVALSGRPALAATATLRAGDQKGGTQSVMKAAGVLEGLPYGLKWSQFPAAAPLLEALNAGAVDVAFAGDAPTTFAMAAGLPGRIISPIRTSGAGTAIMVPKESPIRAAAGLRGRTIAVNRGSIGHALVLAVAETQGWQPGELKLANLFPNDAKTALSTGAVDAWCSWGVYVAQARLVDEARVVVDGRGGLVTGLSYLVAGEQAITQRREALADFCRRLATARRWATAYPDAYARVLAAEIGVSQPVARLVFDTDAPVPMAIDAGVVADEQRIANRFLAAGVIHSALDAARLFDASFNGTLAG